jgi:hypothetical protein
MWNSRRVLTSAVAGAQQVRAGEARKRARLTHDVMLLRYGLLIQLNSNATFAVPEVGRQ